MSTTKTPSQPSPPRIPPEPEPTPAQLVDALETVFPLQPHARAVHAKGFALDGTFTPSAEASTLSRAPHLQSTPVRILARFSNFSGLLTTPDTDPMASPRGLALRFFLPEGGQTDLVMHSFDGFPAATTAEFRELLLAIGSSPPGTPSPTPLERFLANRPRAVAFLQNQIPPPVSYATVRYFGVNAVKLIDSAGQATIGRYQLEPAAGEKSLPETERTSAAASYLRDEIVRRLAGGSIRFAMRFQLAEPGDRVDDPSVTWPASRKTVELGTLDITNMVADPVATDRALLFDTTNLPPGIEPADPMLRARSSAYLESFMRREPK